MYEQLPQQPVVPSEAQVAAWMKVSDEMAPTGQMVSLDRGLGPEELILTDTVYEQYTDEQGNKATRPIVVLESLVGIKEVIGAADYLTWTKFDFDTLEDKSREAVIPTPVAEYAGSVLLDRVAEAQQYKIERAKKLFAPREVADEAALDKEIEAMDFDFLLAKDDTEYKAGQEAYAATKPDKEVASKPSDKDMIAAASELSKALSSDDNIYKVFEKYNLVSAPRLQAVNELRVNADLRLELGLYLQEKIGNPNMTLRLPERVSRDTQKNPNSKGYQFVGNYLSSREYTCMLAISMLDGSFKVEDSQEDTITYDFKTHSGVGQHRAAARLILEDPVYAPGSTLAEMYGLEDL